MDDLKRHRYDVADVLRDICRILGGVPCLRQVVFILEQEVCIRVLPCLVSLCLCFVSFFVCSRFSSRDVLNRPLIFLCFCVFCRLLPMGLRTAS